jgi:hypothetical protein
LIILVSPVVPSDAISLTLMEPLPVTPTVLASPAPVQEVTPETYPTPNYSQVTPRHLPQPSAESSAEMSAQHKLDFTLRRLVAIHQARALTDEDRRAYQLGPNDGVFIAVQAEPGQRNVAIAATMMLGGTPGSPADDWFEAYVLLSTLERLEHVLAIRSVSHRGMPASPGMTTVP